MKINLKNQLVLSGVLGSLLLSLMAAKAMTHDFESASHIRIPSPSSLPPAPTVEQIEDVHYTYSMRKCGLFFDVAHDWNQPKGSKLQVDSYEWKIEEGHALFQLSDCQEKPLTPQKPKVKFTGYGTKDDTLIATYQIVSDSPEGWLETNKFNESGRQIIASLSGFKYNSSAKVTRKKPPSRGYFVSFTRCGCSRPFDRFRYNVATIAKEKQPLKSYLLSLSPPLSLMTLDLLRGR
jgi:hypothetical protein